MVSGQDTALPEFWIANPFPLSSELQIPNSRITNSEQQNYKNPFANFAR